MDSNIKNYKFDTIKEIDATDCVYIIVAKHLKQKLKKGCFIILGVLVLLIAGLILGAKWYLKEAFGPTYRIVEIDSSIGKLICEEEYNADMAAVFYDVDFKLETKNKQPIYLGKLFFQREDWQSQFELKENEKWYYLSSNKSNIYDLVLTDKISQENLSFDLKSSQPKNNKLWKTQKNTIGLPYYTTFIIDSIKQDLLYIKYEYQNIENPNLIKNQTVEFKIDEYSKSLEIINKSEFE